ncbi:MULTISPECIES: ParB/RepB/Spo0J family partition protein [unclassified Halobacteriovorax]|uniref:ParB/RepB/Spo0J family partition protein n=1 Tax=unclassified Halobacteriovorax TaxID=2639665 RepID=UPI002FF022C1
MAKKVALGKGMGSLLGGTSGSSKASKAQAAFSDLQKVAAENQPEKPVQREAAVQVETNPSMLDITSIHANPNQPRKIFKEEELHELSNSIKENGVIQPLIVVKADEGYELVAGERRLRASKLAGLTQVPVVIKRATDREKMVMSIIENVQRSDLNCVEEALAYFGLMEDYNLTQEEVAKKVGKERSTIANFLRILKLPRDVVDLIQKDQLSFGHAKILAGVKEREDCIRIANKAAVDNLSVRETEKLIKASKRAPKEKKEEEENFDFFNGKMSQYREKLEQRTGYHFGIKTNKSGGGEVVLKFANEAEFNDIFEYLLTNR